MVRGSLCGLASIPAVQYCLSNHRSVSCPFMHVGIPVPASPFTPSTGRRLHDDITSSPSFKWAMIAIGCLLGVLLLVGLGFLIYYLTKKKDNKVQPEGASKVRGPAQQWRGDARACRCMTCSIGAASGP